MDLREAMATTRNLDQRAEAAEIAHYAEKGRQYLRSNRGHRESDPAVEALKDLSEAVFQMPRQVLTVHPRYGQPPGELAFKSHVDWTEDERAAADAWLANEQAKDWWRSQAAAQRAAS